MKTVFSKISRNSGYISEPAPTTDLKSCGLKTITTGNENEVNVMGSIQTVITNILKHTNITSGSGAKYNFINYIKNIQSYYISAV